MFARRVGVFASVLNLEALNLLHLCMIRAFCNMRNVVSLRRRRVLEGTVICGSGVVFLRCLAWQARAIFCASVIFDGPVVQFVRFAERRMEPNLSK